jgi:pilus assembly protein CpaB
VAGAPNSNQTVRLIRFGKEQAVLAGSNPTLVGQQSVPMTPDLYPQTNASDGAAAEPTVSIEPQAVPQ